MPGANTNSHTNRTRWLSHADKSIVGESGRRAVSQAAELRRRSGHAQRRKMARKAQVLQGARRGFAVRGESHNTQSRAATGTTQNFNFENPLEQRSPVESGGPPERRGIGSRPSFRFRQVNGRKFRLRQGCHRWAQARRGAEHPMEADVMDPWGWNER